MKEGRRIRTLDPFSTIIPYIMVERSDSQNTINDCFDVSGAEALVRKLRADGYDSIGILHIVLAAYVRAISQRPGVNRYIRGQKIYARKGIVINMAVKKKMSISGQETTIKLHFEPGDTLYDVYKKFNDLLNETIQEEGSENSTDAVAKIIGYIPGLVKKWVIWLLKLLDYFGLLPMALLNASPFHGSMFITSMGSLGVPPIFHHLYDFGNVPVFCSFGSSLTGGADKVVSFSVVVHDESVVNLISDKPSFESCFL